jgi:hypothetical protein
MFYKHMQNSSLKMCIVKFYTYGTFIIQIISIKVGFMLFIK